MQQNSNIYIYLNTHKQMVLNLHALTALQMYNAAYGKPMSWSQWQIQNTESRYNSPNFCATCDFNDNMFKCKRFWTLQEWNTPLPLPL